MPCASARTKEVKEFLENFLTLRFTNGKIFHLVNTNPQPIKQICEWISKCNENIKEEDFDIWIAKVKGSKNPLTPLFKSVQCMAMC